MQEITSVQWGDNISTVWDITQYNGGRILISACLVINNDEKISTFYVLLYEIFMQKFKQISCLLRAGLVYAGPTLFRNG